jgi:beta-phosphoglucomutase-like phosphatase (HAD superfamily)
MEDIKNKIKAIIFDMDGTIINTDDLWKQVIKQVLASHGVITLTAKNEKTLRETASSGLLKTASILKEEFKLSVSVEDLVRQKLELSEKFLVSSHIDFIPGFPDFHKKLQENQIKSGVATNANIRSVNILIPKLSLDSFFGNNIYSIEHAKNKAKPDPDIFLYTAEKLNIKPDECIIFEDSIVGFHAARAAGIRCIAIKNKANLSSLGLVDGAIDHYDQAENEIKRILSLDQFAISKTPEIKQI